jgi:hypothetical protein
MCFPIARQTISRCYFLGMPSLRQVFCILPSRRSFHLRPMLNNETLPIHISNFDPSEIPYPSGDVWVGRFNDGVWFLFSRHFYLHPDAINGRECVGSASIRVVAVRFMPGSFLTNPNFASNTRRLWLHTVAKVPSVRCKFAYWAIL